MNKLRVVNVMFLFAIMLAGVWVEGFAGSSVTRFGYTVAGTMFLFGALGMWDEK